MAKSNLRLVTPATVNRTVAPKRRKNAHLRTREHLSPAEVEKLIEAAAANRHGHSDALMALLAFRHGLRAAEVVDLRWDSASSCSFSPSNSPGSPVFVSERGAPLTAPGFSRMIERAGVAANLGIKVPHMLRHGSLYQARQGVGLPARSLSTVVIASHTRTNTARPAPDSQSP